MKKMLLIMAMAALVCWLPGQALASYTSTLDTVGNHDSTFDVLTNYGTVTVNWIDYNDAKVTVAPLASPDFDFKRTYSAFLNVNGTASVNDISLGWTSCVPTS